MFDKLLLLVSDSSGCGRTAFFGTTAQALEFFQSLEYPCPTYLNPPDHFMRIISSQGIVDLSKKQAAQARAAAVQTAWAKQQPTIDAAALTATDAGAAERYDVSLARQFKTLLWRELLLHGKTILIYSSPSTQD